MKPSIRHKLDSLSERLGELDLLLGEETATRDIDHYRKLSREHAEVSEVVTLYAEYRKLEDDLRAAGQMLADAEMKALAEEEILRCEDALGALFPLPAASSLDALLAQQAASAGTRPARVRAPRSRSAKAPRP